VTPVYIRVEPTTLTKAEPWYRIPARRPHFTLVVGEDVDLQPHRAAPLPVASRGLNERLQEQFEAQRATPGLLNCAPPGNGRMQHAPDVPEVPTNAIGR
jgi:hypothetical protein